MDSLTHVVLGGSVAHLFWHKSLGRKSFAFGAILGTLPDLDIIFYPFLNQTQKLYWHRGEFHSIFFIFLASFLITKIFAKKSATYNLSEKRLFAGLFFIFFTHVAIDYFTVYGTQILSPVSRYGFARGNLFIIDPMYTIPLLLGMLTALLINEKARFKASLTGILISSVYLLFSLGSHFYADHLFKKQLASKNIKPSKSITSATPMNTLLWRHLSLTDKGILVGYFSLISKNSKDEIKFDLIKRNEELIKPFENQPNIKAIKWFSKGFWVAELKDDVLTVSDLRFGELRPFKNSSPDEWEYLFTWKMGKNPNGLKHKRDREISYKTALGVLWERLRG